MSSSVSPSKAWTRLLGTTKWEQARALTTGIDGAIYMAGYTRGNLDGQTNSGSEDAFLTKYNPDGSKAWTRLLGTSSLDYAAALTTGTDGAIYMACSDASLTKYNPDGSTAWTRLLVSISVGQAYALTTGTDGAIYMAGYTEGSLDGQTNSGGSDAFLTKYNPDGSKAWTRLLGTSSYDAARTLTTGTDGAIYMAGSTTGSLDGQTYSGSADAFLTKYNPDGSKAWTRQLGTSMAEEAVALTTGTDGAIYMAGYTVGSLDGQTNSGGSDAFLTKYNPDGSKAWTRLLGTSSLDYAAALTTGTDGAIYMACSDASLTKYNLDGSTAWTRLEEADYTFAYALTTGNDAAIYMAGYTEGSLDGQTNSGGADAFLTKWIVEGSGALIPTVQFSTTSSSANEGNSGKSTVTVQATLSAAATQTVTIPFTYSGTATFGTDYNDRVTSITIAAGSTSGSASFVVVGDTTVESNETVILTMGTPTNATLGTNTSYTHTIVNDDSAAPTYAVTANQSSVNEGSTATFTVTTTNVASGTSLAYSLSGVSASDVTGGSLSGSTTVGSNGQATISVPVAADQTTEGNETLTVTVQGNSASTTILDTSTTPTGTYALAASSSSVNEGGTASFILTTTNVAAGTSLAYTISGVSASDLFSNSLSGSVSVASGGTTVISIPVLADNLTEGTETMTVSLQGRSASINILDTSTTPTPTYSIAANTGEVSEGSNFVVTLTTTNIPAGTIYPWAITSLNMLGRPSSTDFDNGITEGLAVIESTGRATVTLPIKADQLTEGYEDIYFSFYTDITKTRVLANTVASIKDTSVSGPSYALTANQSSVNEGSSATFLLSTTNVAAGSSVAYTLSGISSADIVGGALNGNAVIASNGQATISVPIAADQVTEGTETLTLTVQGKTASTQILDTSLTPAGTYAISSKSASVNEGANAEFTVVATNVLAGTQLTYNLSGISSSDVFGGALSGSTTVASNGQATITIPIAADATTEGDETLTVTVQGKAASTLIKDTSLTPEATYLVTSKNASVTEGSSAEFTVTTTNVAAGTSLAYILLGVAAGDVVGGSLTGTTTVGQNGLATITVPLVADLTSEGNETLTVTVQGKTASTTVIDSSINPQATYELASVIQSVNEGSTATYRLVTTNVAAGTTLAYTLSGVNAADLGTGSLKGSVTVGSNGQATISIPINPDQTTEGNESLTLNLMSLSESRTVDWLKLPQTGYDYSEIYDGALYGTSILVTGTNYRKEGTNSWIMDSGFVGKFTEDGSLVWLNTYSGIFGFQMVSVDATGRIDVLGFSSNGFVLQQIDQGGRAGPLVTLKANSVHSFIQGNDGSSFISGLSNSSNATLTKLANGVQVFQTTISIPGIESDLSSAKDTSGNIFVGGKTSNNATSSSADQIFIAKINPQGQTQWIKNIGQGWLNMTRDIGVATDSENAVYVSFNINVGTSYSTNTAAIAKFDSNGNQVWIKMVATGSAIGRGIVISPDNEVLLFGETYRALDANATAGAILSAPTGFVVEINPSDGSLSRTSLNDDTNFNLIKDILINDSAEIFVLGDLSSSPQSRSAMIGKLSQTEKVLASASVTITDTSIGSGRYELVAGAKSVNEGETASFALWTANVPVGSQLTYTLSGISSSDIVGGSLQGNTLVGPDGKAMITVPIASDFLTEGPETLSVAAYGQTASVTINDTSASLKSIPASFAVVPGSKGFDISPITSATPPTNTGSLFVAKLGNAWTTEFRTNAEQLLKWFQGQGQLTGLSTSQLLDAADAGLTAPNQNDIIQILGLIGDADLRSGSPIYDGLFSYPTTVIQPPPSYELVAPGLSVNEGSVATFTLWTANVPVGTELSYVLGGLTAADIVGGSLQGKTRVESDGRAFISVSLLADALTEGPESLTVTIQGKAASMTVNDTSINVQTDQTPPRLISVSPAIKSTAVAVNQDFVLLFDEGIKLGSVSFSLTSASGSLVAVQARIVGSQLTLDPLADLLEGTTYRLNLPKGSITDLVGNVFDGLFDFEITTAGSIGPPPGF